MVLFILRKNTRDTAQTIKVHIPPTPPHIWRTAASKSDNMPSRQYNGGDCGCAQVKQWGWTLVSSLKRGIHFCCRSVKLQREMPSWRAWVQIFWLTDMSRRTEHHAKPSHVQHSRRGYVHPHTTLRGSSLTRNKVPVNQRRSSTEEVAFGDGAYKRTETYVTGIKSTFKKAK